jgi:Bacterial archaeo-eukaryotic release factor family 3
MRNEAMLKEFAENSVEPCISMVMPIESRSFDDLENIRSDFKNELADLAKILKSDYDEHEIIDNLVCSAEEIIDVLDFTHVPQGVGVYVSPGFAQEVLFPFVVEKKMIIDKEFDLTAIKALVDNDFHYNALLLCENTTRLFSGEETSLVEVLDGNFPYTGADEKHSKVHYQIIDKLIKPYTSGRPLILVGDRENLDSYKSIARHRHDIIGEVSGNYEKNNLYEISSLVWPIVEPLYLKNKFGNKPCDP